MSLGFITSADAVFMLSAAGVYSNPQQIQEFAVDRAFTTEAADIVEAQLGVDGVLSFGWLPRMFSQTVMLQANSPSGLLFDTINQTGQSLRQPIILAATITLPGIGQQYDLTNGSLKSYPPIPEVAKTLSARTFSIVWGGISASPASNG
jgi:hypothetical protein